MRQNSQQKKKFTSSSSLHIIFARIYCSALRNLRCFGLPNSSCNLAQLHGSQHHWPSTRPRSEAKPTKKKLRTEDQCDRAMQLATYQCDPVAQATSQQFFWRRRHHVCQARRCRGDDAVTTPPLFPTIAMANTLQLSIATNKFINPSFFQASSTFESSSSYFIR